ncbi:hypothetical protein K461DRAFT_266533 [Myriangium duriaei CBS 260.36]|uniref:Uncharacterized protein n=1 Tax=Myriangium duriaei CBS 260.36 TaxID=1168546 RepID=A0A9P4MMI4_9PEZI|nr:hypothetical protein K461DRAFT_266533 [Myriangium duriaei CBS 260.36]
MSAGTSCCKIATTDTPETITHPRPSDHSARDNQPILAYDALVDLPSLIISFHKPRMARSSSPSAHRKPCTLCHTPRDVLIRCQIDDTGTWHMVCPGKCWQDVSGGVDDGDAAHPNYRYGGAWKNKHAGVSAKKPQRVKDRQRAFAAVPEWSAEERHYAVNDRVGYSGSVWICRRSHISTSKDTPKESYGLWKQDDQEDRVTDGEQHSPD